MRLYALTLFSSAFLLFQVQPLIGKTILPWFGSSPGVWTTAVLFFQLWLLAGYLYAHFIATRLSNRNQAVLHLTLLAGSFLLLPIAPSEVWKPAPGDDPIQRILLLLTASIGGPYLLLSATSPLLQRWFARIHPGRSPYRLYAVSNAGSLLALLSYPFIFEPFFRLQTQTRIWSAGFVVVALLGGLCAYRLVHSPPFSVAVDVAIEPPRLSRILLWLGLAASGSIMLLATLNRVTQDVTPVPFLFVLPLALYLLTFIITFDHPRWYNRPLFCSLLLLVLGWASANLYLNPQYGGLTQISMVGFTLLVCCMACHGELARLKPSPEHLTLFFLMVALGGAVGGVLVAVVAPHLFSGFWEYEIGLFVSFGLVMFLVSRDLLRRTKDEPPRPRSRRLGWTAGFAGVFGLMVLATGFARNFMIQQDISIARSRNFYGLLRVIEAMAEQPRLHKYRLYHGDIEHGFQYRHPEKRSWPTTYYGKSSGVGIAIEHHPRRKVANLQFRIGAVGLGAGTLATYANEADYVKQRHKMVDDTLRFYEINSEVIRLAEDHFTFLQDARDRGAGVEVIHGDARIAMEQQMPQNQEEQFDVLAVDAFNGDAVPMHLLTQQCFDIYFRHLKPDGILAVHTSNRYLNLFPVVQASAAVNGKQAHLIVSERDPFGAAASRWVLVTSNERFLRSERLLEARTPTDENHRILWTDDFSSLFSVFERR